MRTYLVVVDETDEARVALRFASRRAQKTGGALHILAIVPKQAFVAWGGVQATIEEEAKDRAEALVNSAAGSLFDEMGRRPAISVHSGDAVEEIKTFLIERDDVAALVLGAAKSGPPGPLVSHFTGSDVGKLSCPVLIVPGSFSNDDIDRLS